MKQLIPITNAHVVFALTGFAIECNPIQIAQRIRAIPKRLQELNQQISMLRRYGDKEEAEDLSQHRDNLSEQLIVVQKIFKATRVNRDDMYAEFYSKHGHEAPDKP